MPIYTYTCSDCKHTFDVSCSCSVRDEGKDCEKCDGVSNRNMQSEISGGSAFDATMKDNPRWSDALGVVPNQIPEFKKRFGSLMEFNNEGQCLVKSRHHKMQLLKARGYTELD